MDMVGVRHRCVPKPDAPVAQRIEQGPSKSEAAGSSPAGRTKPKGRPLDKDLHLSLERTKPWEAEGMSRATWYRRRRANPS